MRAYSPELHKESDMTGQLTLSLYDKKKRFENWCFFPPSDKKLWQLTEVCSLFIGIFLVTQMVKYLPAMQENWLIPGLGRSLEGNGSPSVFLPGYFISVILCGFCSCHCCWFAKSCPDSFVLLMVPAATGYLSIGFQARMKWSLPFPSLKSSNLRIKPSSPAFVGRFFTLSHLGVRKIFFINSFSLLLWLFSFNFLFAFKLIAQGNEIIKHVDHKRKRGLDSHSLI